MLCSYNFVITVQYKTWRKNKKILKKQFCIVTVEPRLQPLPRALHVVLFFFNYTCICSNCCVYINFTPFRRWNVSTNFVVLVFG